MDKKKLQDDWTTTFCVIFKELVNRGKIQKKGTFVDQIELSAHSTLNHVLQGSRKYPLHKRQRAMEVLRDLYHVNLEYFKSRSNPMFLVNMEEDAATYGAGKGRGGATYAELVECQKIREENEYLKQAMKDKDLIIQTQAALIAQLQGAGPAKK